MPVNFLSASPSSKFNHTPSSSFHIRAHSQPPSPVSHTPPSRSINSSPASHNQPRARSRNRLRKHRKTASVDTHDEKHYHLEGFCRICSRLRAQQRKDERELYSSQSRGTLGGFWSPHSGEVENVNERRSVDLVKPGFTVEVGLGIDDIVHQEVEQNRNKSIHEIEIVLDTSADTENYTWTSVDEHADDTFRQEWITANGHHEDTNQELLELPAEAYSPRSSSIYSEDRTLVAELDATIQALRNPSPARIYASPEQLAVEYQALILPYADRRLPASSSTPSPRPSTRPYKSQSAVSSKPGYQKQPCVTPGNPLGISTTSLSTPQKVKSDISTSNLPGVSAQVPVSVKIIPQVQSPQPKPLRKVRPHASLRTLASSSSISSLRSPISTRCPEDSPPPVPAPPIPKAKSTSPRYSTSNVSTISSCSTLVDVPAIPAPWSPSASPPNITPNSVSPAVISQARAVEMIEVRNPNRPGTGLRWGEIYQNASANNSASAVHNTDPNAERVVNDANAATLPILHPVAYAPPLPPSPAPAIPSKSARRRSYSTSNINLNHNHSTPNLPSHHHNTQPPVPLPPAAPRVPQTPFPSSALTGVSHSRSRSYTQTSTSRPFPSPSPSTTNTAARETPDPEPEVEEPKWVEIPTSESLQLGLTLLTSSLSTSLLRKSRSRLQQQASPSISTKTPTSQQHPEENPSLSSSSSFDNDMNSATPKSLKPKRIGLPEIHILLSEYASMRENVRQEVQTLRVLATASHSQSHPDGGSSEKDLEHELERGRGRGRNRDRGQERDIKAELRALEQKEKVLSTWVAALQGLVQQVEGYRRSGSVSFGIAGRN